MKTKKLYSVPGTNLADSDDYKSLRSFANRMGQICDTMDFRIEMCE